jgi:hypothetical protein
MVRQVREVFAQAFGELRRRCFVQTFTNVLQHMGGCCQNDCAHISSRRFVQIIGATTRAKAFLISDLGSACGAFS